MQISRVEPLDPFLCDGALAPAIEQQFDRMRVDDPAAAFRLQQQLAEIDQQKQFLKFIPDAPLPHQGIDSDGYIVYFPVQGTNGEWTISGLLMPDPHSGKFILTFVGASR